MKKIITIIVALSVLVVLTGCGKKELPTDKTIESVTRNEKEDIKTVTEASAEDDASEKEKAKEESFADEQEESAGEVEEKTMDDNKTEVEKPAVQEEEKPSEINLDEIKNEIVNSIDASGGLDFNANSINALYGIAPSDMKQCTGFSVMAGTFPHEVVMIEATDDDAAKKIETALESKIETFTQQSRNYDASDYALAQKCKLQKNGKFYALFLSPDYDAIMTVYKKYVK